MSVAELGLDAVFVSDNLGIVQIDAKTAADSQLDRPVYFVCSLFDGRFMNEKGVLDSWMSAFSFKTRTGVPIRSEPLASMAIDFPAGKVAFCDTKTALKCRIDTQGKIGGLSLCKPDSSVGELSQCQALTTLLDTESFNENVDKIKGAFAGFETISDSGACRGFVEVASGRKRCLFCQLDQSGRFFLGGSAASRIRLCFQHIREQIDRIFPGYQASLQCTLFFGTGPFMTRS